MVLGKVLATPTVGANLDMEDLGSGRRVFTPALLIGEAGQ
jgi:hypothetical protein